jgi:hypothetical protein
MRTNNAILAVAMWFMLTGNAYAYLDPGTASIALQVIIGAVASGLFMMKIYWAKFKSLIGMGGRDDDSDGGLADQPK